MKKRYTIQVRNAGAHGRFDWQPGEVRATIKRVIWAEQIGNFNPFFCRYKGKRELVQSLDGDVSDPFRCEESYANTFYIVPAVELGEVQS